MGFKDAAARQTIMTKPSQLQKPVPSTVATLGALSAASGCNRKSCEQAVSQIAQATQPNLTEIARACTDNKHSEHTCLGLS